MRSSATPQSTPVWDFRIIADMSRLAAEIIWLLGIIAWFVIRYPFARRSRKTAVASSLQDWLEWTLLGGATLGLFIIPLVFVTTGWPLWLDHGFVPGLAWLGLAVMLAALWLFWRSHADLGRGWSASLKVREAHALVTDGVYRRIRHPMYLSFLLLGLAQLQLLPNWLAGSVGLFSALLMFALRVEREEAMMIDRFGAHYRDYMARSKRIIPGLYQAATERTSCSAGVRSGCPNRDAPSSTCCISRVRCRRCRCNAACGLPRRSKRAAFARNVRNGRRSSSRPTRWSARRCRRCGAPT